MKPIERGVILNGSAVFKKFFKESTMWKDIETHATGLYEELKESLVNGDLVIEEGESFDLWRGRCQGYAMLINSLKIDLSDQGEKKENG